MKKTNPIKCIAQIMNSISKERITFTIGFIRKQSTFWLLPICLSPIEINNQIGLIDNNRRHMSERI